MKKTGLLCLAVVLALGTIGAGFAYWTETLTIGAAVTAGDLNVSFYEDSFSPFWDGQSEGGIATRCWNVSPDRKSSSITLGNTYPGYWTGLHFRLRNFGTVPAKIKSVVLKNVNDPGVLLPYIECAGYIRHLNPDESLKADLGPFNGQMSPDQPGPGPLSSAPSAIFNTLYGQVLTPGEWFYFEGGDGALYLKIDQDAPNSIENFTISFDLEFIFEQWNAP